MKDGYIIRIYQIINIKDGIVDEEGEAIFTVRFKALVFKPLCGHVLDGVVGEVNNIGLQLKIGTVKAFIPHNKIPDYYSYEENTGTFVNVNERLNIIDRQKVGFIYCWGSCDLWVLWGFR